ncbi:hypothetical protein Ddc_08128 [Ditylenchus destructor]|nr:hypothetical protein Ddc_08128 [Ditylenchus destructor]
MEVSRHLRGTALIKDYFLKWAEDEGKVATQLPTRSFKIQRNDNIKPGDSGIAKSPRLGQFAREGIKVQPPRESRRCGGRLPDAHVQTNRQTTVWAKAVAVAIWLDGGNAQGIGARGGLYAAGGAIDVKWGRYPPEMK